MQISIPILICFILPFLVVVCILLTQVLLPFEENYADINTFDYAKLGLNLIALVIPLFIISRQPVSSASLAFKVPFVPWVPGFSLLINIYLMIKLDIMTWVRFSMWIAIGLVIFFAYSVRHSRMRRRELKNFTESESRERSEANSISSLQHDESFSTQVPLMVMQTIT